MSNQTQILVCCDDPERQALYTQGLAGAGYRLEFVNVPARVAAVVGKVEWGAILIDLASSPTQAFFLVTHIREQIGDLRVPILLVTDEMRPTDTIRGLQVGATDCVTRTAPISEMRFALDRCSTVRGGQPTPQQGSPRSGASSPFPIPAAPPGTPPANRPPLRFSTAGVFPSTAAAAASSRRDRVAPSPFQEPPEAMGWPQELMTQPPPARAGPSTEPVALLESQHRDRFYRELFDRLDTGVVVLTPDHAIDSINTAGRQLLEIFEPGRIPFPARIGGVDRADFLSHLSRGTLGGDVKPIALLFERGATKSVVGSVSIIANDLGQSLGHLVLVRDHRAQLELPRSIDDIRISREAIDTLGRAEQSLNVLSRSIALLDREKLLNNPAALRSFELMRNDFERLFTLVRVLRDVRQRR